MVFRDHQPLANFSLFANAGNKFRGEPETRGEEPRKNCATNDLAGDTNILNSIDVLRRN